MTDGKFQQYKRRYGKDAAFNPTGDRPNYERCAHEVERFSKGRFFYHQCTRKCGHGPDGAFCKQHSQD